VLNFKFWSIKRKVKRHFSFLYDLGFRISSSKYQPERMGYWEINLHSQNLFVEIYSDRGEIMLSVGNEDKYGLAVVIFFISQGKEFISHYEGNFSDLDGQLQRISAYLQKYLDKITYIFGHDYATYREILKESRDKYELLAIEHFRKSHPPESLMKYVPKRKSST
jgi:hypothetical protein